MAGSVGAKLFVVRLPTEGTHLCREVEGACLLLEATFGVPVRHRLKEAEIGQKRQAISDGPASLGKRTVPLFI